MKTNPVRKNQTQRNSRPTTLVIGGYGFVGGYFLQRSSYSYPSKHYLVPTHTDLDITNKHNVLEYFAEIKPQCIINFAAYTNMDESEKERNNKKGKTLQTNYVGVNNIVDVCKKYNSFFILISTDAVFPGTDDHPGPYSEHDAPPKNGKGLNWYGFSKLRAEEKIKTVHHNYAIIRISHPFGNPKSERDLVRKTIRDITVGHRLFADQLFTPTFLEDLTKTIWKIQSGRISGIFHVGCRGLVARIEFSRYLSQKLNMKEELKVGSLKEFLAVPHRAPRTRLGGFETSETQKKLGITFHTWQEALDKTILLI